MTFASLAVAVVMVGIGIFIVGYRGATGTALFTGGTITGLGIASMHYLGMASMSLDGRLEYNTLTVAASVAIAMAAATAALWAAAQAKGFLWSVGASVVMGLAVTGMHYTGMAALEVHVHGTADPATGESAAALLAPMMLGPLALLVLAGIVVIFDPLMIHGPARPGTRRAQARHPRPPAGTTPPRRTRHACGRVPAAPSKHRTRTPQKHWRRDPLSAGGRTVGDMRPVSQIERTVAPFEVVSPFQPSGDQPTAIADLARRIEAGEKDVVLLGATGTGKSATTAWMIEKLQRPTLVMAPNKTLAAQTGQRVPRAAPEQRGRILRLVLRLLPARGVRPAVGHLHREGLLGQRGGRAAAPLRDQLPAHPPRRRRGRLRLLHLRPRHPAGVRGPHGAAPRRRGIRPGRAAAPLRGHPVHAQRPGLHPGHLPRPR
ncbi:UvrABC system protein B [Streptomyces hirsutus]